MNGPHEAPLRSPSSPIGPETRLPKPGSNVPWLVSGTVALALAFAVAAYYGRQASPAQVLASKARRVDLVGRMQLELTSASEAEKSAVLATTGEEARRFAEQARAAAAEVGRARQELDDLLATDGTRDERERLAAFSSTFADLERIDDEVLRLAGQNTNLAASALSFGPAANTLAEFDSALARLTAKHTDAAGGAPWLRRAFDARIGLLRLQVLLAPHIAEESDAKMDQMEAVMTHDQRQVAEDLDALATTPEVRGDADLAAAVTAFRRYGEIKARILELSRQNTNVRSLTLSLNQKRKAMVASLVALSALREAILAEPIAGVDYGLPARPR